MTICHYLPADYYKKPYVALDTAGVFYESRFTIRGWMHQFPKNHVIYVHVMR